MPPAFAPRLTLGIPTQGRRPDRLLRAVASAVAQSAPTRVLIADQSPDGVAAEILRDYLTHPLVRLVKSPATCLWENWTYAAESCDTELFGWLQDDDVISPRLAQRAIEGLDRAPDAAVWLARLGISLADGAGNWWQATGPMVPMDLLYGGRTSVHGRLLAAVAFFSSFALSPGVVFRCTLDAIECVRRCPRDADLFNERIILAELGRLGDAVCDPAYVGYWTHHEANESRRQVEAGEVGPQYRRMGEHVAAILRNSPGWKGALSGWGLIVGREHCLRYAADAEHYPLEDVPEWVEAVKILRTIAGEAHRTAEDSVPVPGTARLIEDTPLASAPLPESAPSAPPAQGNGRLPVHHHHHHQRKARQR